MLPKNSFCTFDTSNELTIAKIFNHIHRCEYVGKFGNHFSNLITVLTRYKEG